MIFGDPTFGKVSQIAQKVIGKNTYCQWSNKHGMLAQQNRLFRDASRMFVAKDRPGAGSRNGRDRTIEDTKSDMEGRGPLRPCAEHARGSRVAARVELTRELRASEETLQGLTEFRGTGTDNSAKRLGVVCTLSSYRTGFSWLPSALLSAKPSAQRWIWRVRASS